MKIELRSSEHVLGLKYLDVPPNKSLSIYMSVYRNQEEQSDSSYMNEEEEALLQNKFTKLETALKGSIAKDKLKFSLFDLRRSVEYCGNNVLANNSSNDQNSSDDWKTALEQIRTQLAYIEHELSSKTFVESEKGQTDEIVDEIEQLKKMIVSESSNVNRDREVLRADHYTSRILFLLLLSLILWGSLQLVIRS